MRHQLPSENTKMFGSRRDYTLLQCLIIEHVIERGFYGVTDELRHKHAIFPQTRAHCSLICKVIILLNIRSGKPCMKCAFCIQSYFKISIQQPPTESASNLLFFQEEDGEVSQGCQQHGNISVKQRHPSSPMASPPIPDHFDQTGHPQFKSRTSPYFQSHHPGPEGTSSTGNPFFANQFYPFQTGFSGHKMASDPISRFVLFCDEQICDACCLIPDKT